MTDRRQQLYERGATTVFACRMDPRFSYCLHVPRSFDEAPGSHRLVVAVHGSSRTMGEFRDSLGPFAELRRCVILAPLFPVGVCGDDNGDGYKYLVEGTIRYDLVLIAMIDEAAARLSVSFPRHIIFGFSGGAQFVNRFLLLHPGRLMAVSIAAPGSVTLVDPAHRYWVGTKDLEAVFGVPLDLAALRSVPVQLLVGGDDTESWEIAYAPGSPGYLDGINDSGSNRIERSRTLQVNLASQGVDASLHIVPGAGHDWHPLMPAFEAFCREVLAAGSPS